MLSVAHPVVCVIEFAACSSAGVVIDGRIADRPAVKNGDANASSALSRYSSHGRWSPVVRMNRIATTARKRSLAIITCRRSIRSSSTPANGDASTDGIARDRNISDTTSPEPEVSMMSASTATELK